MLNGKQFEAHLELVNELRGLQERYVNLSKNDRLLVKQLYVMSFPNEGSQTYRIGADFFNGMDRIASSDTNNGTVTPIHTGSRG